MNNQCDQCDMFPIVAVISTSVYSNSQLTMVSGEQLLKRTESLMLDLTKQSTAEVSEVNTAHPPLIVRLQKEVLQF